MEYSTLLTWRELVDTPIPDTVFLVTPWIPRRAVVLLYGKFSTGKSPLTWELARCVGEGQSFFGRPTERGRVLYLELDTPRALVRKRVSLMEAADGVWWGFLAPCPDPLVLQRFNEQIEPDLVIVDTLRKAYAGSDIESATPSQVYGRYQRLFPRAAILFVHHDRKTDLRAERQEPDESFAGSQAWINDAQSALHVQRSGPAWFALHHTKSQVSELTEPYLFRLRDGVIAPPLEVDILREWPQTAGRSLSARLQALACTLQVSERTLWSRYKTHPSLFAN